MAIVLERFSAMFESTSLRELISIAERADADARIIYDSRGPWYQIDVYGRYGLIQFGVWRVTDALYVGDEYGAMGDDPIDLAYADTLVTKGWSGV